MTESSDLKSAKAGLAILKKIADDTGQLRLPPEVGRQARTQQVIPLSVVQDTRNYLEIIANQINGPYEKGWYDACAVMMRRLVETLIIELFEARGRSSAIKDGSGNYVRLDALIGRAIGEGSWNLHRDTRQVLKKVKQLGDNSAHSHRFNAHRTDIDNIQLGFRTAVQDLIRLAGMDGGATK